MVLFPVRPPRTGHGRRFVTHRSPLRAAESASALGHLGVYPGAVPFASRRGVEHAVWNPRGFTPGGEV